MSVPSMYKNEAPMCSEGKALLASELQFLRAQKDTKTKAKPEEAKANKRKVRREEVEEYILLKMYPPSNQPQAPDEEEEDQPEELEDGDNFKSKDSTIKDPGQETSHGYYNQRFGQTQDFRMKSMDALIEKCSDFLCSGEVSASSPMKISYGRLIQEGFNLTSPKPKAKKRKAEIIEVHGDGGGRVVRSTGRKDRHSKVRTARGPRDRRVRLSPRTAIQFYDVQDRLGCDRPSKAIDWLIKEAKTAIDALDQLPHLERNNHFSDTNATENHSPPILNHGGFVISESGMIEKSEHLNDNSPASGFSFRVDGAAPSSSTELQAYLDQDFNTSRNRSEASDDVIFYPSYPQGFCSALTAASQIMETNSGIATLQKMLSWNYGNDNSGSTRGGRGGRGGGGAGGGDRAEYSSVNSPPLHSPAQPISGDNHMFSQREPLQSSIINYSPIGADFPGFNFSNELSNIIASATLKEDENEKKLVFSRPSSTAPFLHYEE